MSELLRLIPAVAFLAAGVIVVIVAVVGVMKFRFVMNRMHCAALLDALGMSLILVGLAFAAGKWSFVPKLALILIFQWIGSPIASHMVGRIVVNIGDDIAEHMQIVEEEPEEPAEPEEQEGEHGSY